MIGVGGIYLVGFGEADDEWDLTDLDEFSGIETVDLQNVSSLTVSGQQYGSIDRFTNDKDATLEVDGQGDSFTVTSSQVNYAGWDNFINSGNGRIVIDDGDNLVIGEQNSFGAWDGAELVNASNSVISDVAESGDGNLLEFSFTGDGDGGKEIAFDVEGWNGHTLTFGFQQGSVASSFSGQNFEDLIIEGFDPDDESSLLDFSAVDGNQSLWFAQLAYITIVSADDADNLDSDWLVLTGYPGDTNDIFAVQIAEDNDNTVFNLQETYAAYHVTDFVDAEGRFIDGEEEAFGDWVDPGEDQFVGADSGTITLMGVDMNDLSMQDFAGTS